MAERNRCDEYADELVKRFGGLVDWALEHWPIPESPLMRSDFEPCQAAMHAILGERLNEAQQAAIQNTGKESDGQPQDRSAERQTADGETGKAETGDKRGPHTSPASDPAAGGEQYVNINPTPWP